MTVEKVNRAHDTLSDLLLNSAMQKRTLNRPWNRPGISGKGLRTWAIVIAVGWHVAFMVCLAPRRIPPPPRSAAPVSMAYLPAAPGSENGLAADDVRGVWSPVLFALPSEKGFSGPVLARELVQAPPLAPPEDSSVVLPFSPARRARQTVIGRALGGRSGEGSLLALVPHREPVFKVTPAAISEGPLRIRFAGSLGKPTSAPMSTEGTPGGKAWEAHAYLVADEDGLVTQVFLENPTSSPEWNQCLTRSLWQMTFEPGPSRRSGRISIRYLGDQSPTRATTKETG